MSCCKLINAMEMCLNNLGQGGAILLNRKSLPKTTNLTGIYLSGADYQSFLPEIT